MDHGTFISSLAWIHRGFAASVPLEYNMDEEEVQEIKNDPMVSEHLRNQQAMEQQMDQEDQDLPIFGDDIRGVTFQDNYPNGFQDMEDDEKEDYYIKDTDALIVAGKIEKQYSCLQVYVYQQDKNNLYVHHEIMLSSFPLSISWLNTNLGSLNSNQHQKGNYAIVASFLPQIQVWNLDLTQAIEPEMLLGGQIQTNKKKPKKFSNNSKKFKEGSHTDSVVSLSLNNINKSILASGSTDKSLKIWDLSKSVNIFTSEHHKKKINKVQWNPVDPSIIYTISQDHHIAVLDSRYPKDRLYHKTTTKSQMTSACWNVNEQTQIAYVTQDGGMYMIDVRVPDKVLCSQKDAHKGEQITDIKIGKKNMCFTCSEDQTVKVWSLSNLNEPLAHKNPHCGKLFCLDLMESEEGPVIGCGNAKGELFIWDTTENQNIDAYWKS